MFRRAVAGLAALTWCALAGAWPAPLHVRRGGPGVAVLVYHNFISDDEAARRPGLLDEMTMSRAQLVAQIEQLKREGARFLTLAEFVAHVRGTAPAPRHAVLIAIDDGYESVYKIAWPVLREARVPSMVALIVSATEDPAGWAKKHPNAAPHLTWSEIHEMMQPVPEVGGGLVALASHTFDMHENLWREERALAGKEREALHARLLSDLKKAREVIAARTGAYAGFLVWPHGGFSAELLAVARAAGHEGTFGDLGPVVRPGADEMNMTRVHAGSGTRSRGALERNMRSAGW